MRVLVFGMMLGLATFLTARSMPAVADESPPQVEKEKSVSVWMEKKMEYSEQMLRGLVLGDFDTVAKKAEQMRLVSKVEGWLRGKKPGYRAQLQAFEFANSEILRHAEAENLEGTAMAFQQLTASCVSCHKIIRGVNGHPAPPSIKASKE